MGSGKEKIISIKGLRIDYRGLAHLSIQNLIKNPALKGGRVIHALRGVDLEVEKGEILGIIGENGAGKSTLLKAVAGIFQPDEGSIDTHGNRVSLMSLGVGFKWDLSGRDNIMLAGLLLRYPKQYIRDKMQEIIDSFGDEPYWVIQIALCTNSKGVYCLYEDLKDIGFFCAGLKPMCGDCERMYMQWIGDTNLNMSEYILTDAFNEIRRDIENFMIKGEKNE